MPDKGLQMLGLARRAGKLTVGFDVTVELARQGKAALVMLASDLSEKSEKEWRFAVGEAHADVRRFPHTKAEISAAAGFGKPIGIIATDDEGFARTLREYCIEE